MKSMRAGRSAARAASVLTWGGTGDLWSCLYLLRTWAANVDSKFIVQGLACQVDSGGQSGREWYSASRRAMR